MIQEQLDCTAIVTHRERCITDSSAARHHLGSAVCAARLVGYVPRQIDMLSSDTPGARLLLVSHRHARAVTDEVHARIVLCAYT